MGYTLAPITGLVIANSGVTCMARLCGAGGALVTQASISSIGYAIRDLTDGETDSASTLTVSSVIYDSLQQTDPRWTKDSAIALGKDGRWGYNFLNTFAATLFTDFDMDATTKIVTPHKFQVNIWFTPASGQKFHVPFQFTPIPVWET